MAKTTGLSITLGNRDDREQQVRRKFWRKLAASIGRISFAREAVAAYFCATDPKTPTRVKAILLAALAYFILPTDFIPDFLIGFGFTDDAAVLFAAWRSVEPHIENRHRRQAHAVLEQGIPPAAEDA